MRKGSERILETLPDPDARWAEIEASPRPATLDQLLRDAVGRHADDQLLDFFENGITLTYSEFDALVDRMACVLSRAGVEQGTHVGLLLPNVPLYPAAFLALARLGAVFVPLNSRLTAAEIDHVCKEADVSFIIVHAARIASLDGSKIESAIGPGRILVTGCSETQRPPERGIDLDMAIADTSVGDDYPRPQPGPRDLVSILFTSGSTGLPKGCMHTHTYWLVLAQTAVGLLPEAKRELLDTPFSYMMGPLGLVSALATGGTLVLAKGPTLSGYVERLREQRIEHTWFPGVLLKTPESPSDRDHPLRKAWVESLPEGGYEELERRFGVVARPSLGMTEIGMGTFIPWEEESRGSAGIGVPGPFRECMAVDQDLEPVPDGTIGELCVRGPGLFLGYYKRDEVNAESFFGEGWFRTGDLVTREADGHYFYVGRAKAMVRRAGEQVSAQEVENALLEMSAVAGAAVVPVPDPQRGEEVKAYIALAGEATAEDVPPEQIFAWSRERLASFKVPRYLEYRDVLPRTASEKVDKPALLAEKDDLREGSYDRVDETWR